MNDTKLLYLRAKCFFFMENFDQAIKHLQMGLQSDPDNQLLAKTFKLYKKMLRVKEKGNASFKSGKYLEAIEHYTAVIELLGKSCPKKFMAKLYSNRASSLVKLRKQEEAINDFEKALELDSTYSKAYLKKASCLIDLGGEENLNKAMHCYTEAEKLVEDRSLLSEIRQGQRKVKLELKKAKRKDYYKILDLKLKERSTQHEIKKAYRKMALKYHPDRHASKTDKEKEAAEKAFKDVGEAYAILSDEQKREKYDAGYNYEEIEHGVSSGGGPGGMSQDDLMRMFASQFAGGGGGRGGGFGGSAGPGFSFSFG